MLKPELKFKKLPDVIKWWFPLDPKKDIRGISEEQKRLYVNTMRNIFKKNRLISAKVVTNEIEKLGTNSIHRGDVVNLFGRIQGKILFEIMTVSSRLNAKIITFGRKTSKFLRKLKITVIESTSKLKHKIKTNRGIKTGLMIMLFTMSLSRVQEFINMFELEPFPFELTTTVSLGAFGVLMMGNG